MQKILKSFIILTLFSLIITGCSQKDDTRKLESFDMNTSENVSEQNDESYQFLAKTKIKNGGAYIRVYIPIDTSLDFDNPPAASSLQGITVRNELIKNDEAPDVSDISKEEQDRLEKKLKENKQIKKIVKKTGDETKDCSLREINYSITKDDRNYPCKIIIKTQLIQDSYYLRTVITVDNTKAGDDTAAILKEVLKAYGLSFGEESETDTQTKDDAPSEDSTKKDTNSFWDDIEDDPDVQSDSNVITDE